MAIPVDSAHTHIHTHMHEHTQTQFTSDYTKYSKITSAEICPFLDSEPACQAFIFFPSPLHGSKTVARLPNPEFKFREKALHRALPFKVK